MGIGEALSAFLQGILHKLNPVAAAAQLGESDGMKADQDRLRRLLNHLQVRLQVAEQRQRQVGITALWLRELKDLADDVEELLDDFEYEELRSLAEGGSSYGSTSSGAADWSRNFQLLSQVRSSLSSPNMLPQQGSLRDAMAGRVAAIWRRFDEIKSNSESLHLSQEFDDGAAQTETNRQVRRETSSFLTSEVLGRDGLKQEIIDFLVGGPVEGLSVLAIVGIGGVGKTTLAQLIYNDARVGTHFNQKIWIHVSCDFDLKRVTRQIIEHVAGPQSLLHQMGSLNVLQMALANTLQDKHFLLVLDDMWHDDHMMDHVKPWEALCAPLMCGGKGSKILLTTRSSQVLQGVVQPVKRIDLDGLEFKDSWSLFKKHAFLNVNSGRHPRLECMGKRIVKKLNGVPLAISAIASLLCSKLEESEWESVVESELWELKQGDGGILPALRLSYEHLPPHLKPCFAYCSVFEKGCPFDKLELLQLWMASGYVQCQGKRRMEEVGSDYLNCLVNRSLIQFFDGKYRVHDLLHDLGRFTLQHDYCAIETDQLNKISAEAQCQRHLSLLVHRQPDLSELEGLQVFKKLRTLSFLFHHITIRQMPCSLFMSLTCLRVLDLSSHKSIQNIPDSVGNLRHLRYLDLRETPISYLPESVCNLYMLQTLRLQGCDQLGTIPKSISNLVNLRYLEVRHELVSRVPGIGKLIHLQELRVFSISEGDGIKIQDLKNMDELQDGLCIHNLERVRSGEEASAANLRNKKYIKKLELEWAEEDQDVHESGEVEEAVLDALVPPPELKELTIKGFNGAKTPRWMNSHLSVSGLESISLRRCQRWVALPPLITRLPHLKKLEVAFFSQLKELPPLPTTLVYLTLEDVGLNDVSVAALETLSSLQSLAICNTPHLCELPPLPTTLKTLTLENLEIKVLPQFSRIRRDPTGGDSPLLGVLEIVGCRNLWSLDGVLKHHLPHLTVMSLKDCEELMFWPEGEGFRATLESLGEELCIDNCPRLMALPEGSVISRTLKQLTVKDSPNFLDRSFFAQLHELHNLTGAGDLYVGKQYQDLTTCSEEALQQVREVGHLIINFIDDKDSSELLPFVSLVYGIKQVAKQRCLEPVSYRRVILNICSGASFDEDYSYSNILSTCLCYHQHLCSSLVYLSLNNCMPQGKGGLLVPRWGGASSCLPSLQEFVIMGPRDLAELPVETLLHHLGHLKHLCIIDCPELTLPALEEAIQSLPSLEALLIQGCPRVSLHVPSTPASSSNTSSSAPLPLRCLITDDVRLLAGQFACDHLSALWELSLQDSDVSFFPATKEDCWLRSLRGLNFIKCTNLQEFPQDLASLVPSLEVLCVVDCPRLRCVPEKGLPSSLQVLSIQGSPELEAADWHKIAMIRLVVIDGIIEQGSYSDYQEMVGKGLIVYAIF